MVFDKSPKESENTLGWNPEEERPIQGTKEECASYEALSLPLQS